MTLSRIPASLRLLTLIVAIFSTTYAHAGPAYTCVYENASEHALFSLKIREESSEGTLTYQFLPRDASASASGKIAVRKTSATWSHFVFTGNDSTSSVSLSVPVGLADNSIYLDMKFRINGEVFQTLKYLQCRRD